VQYVALTRLLVSRSKLKVSDIGDDVIVLLFSIASLLCWLVLKAKVVVVGAKVVVVGAKVVVVGAKVVVVGAKVVVVVIFLLCKLFSTSKILGAGKENI